jgi:hypothetical protein
VDAEVLGKIGVQAVFTPGATTEAIVEWVREHVPAED